MELYVTQLIEDLEAAHQPNEPYSPDSEESTVSIFEEAEQFISGENHKKICDLIGFFPEQFPPSNRLNTNQIKRIFYALDLLLDSYNIDTNLPNKLPIKRKYELLINEMMEVVFVDKHGFTLLEYCEFDERTCPFGKKYCECKDYKYESNSNSDLKDSDNDELPF